MKHNYKIFSTILLLILIFLCLSNTAYARDVVDNLSIDVELLDDGSAIITEVWDTYASIGTENYKTFENLDGASIEYLRVYEDGIEYQDVADWNSNASRTDKAYKSGIKQIGPDSYEIIWGIGDYGRHIYTVEYKINNFVYRYDKSAGVYWKFVGKDFDLPIENLEFRMHRRSGFDYDDVRIWSYGYLGGVYLDKNGSEIYGGSDSRLASYNFFEVKVAMPNDYVPYAEKRSGDIESVWLEEEEMREREDKFERFIDNITTIVITIVFIVGGIAVSYFGIKLIVDIKKYNAKFKLGDEKYFSTPPLDNYLLLHAFAHFRNKKKWSEHLFDAVILQLTLNNNIQVEKINELKDTKSNNIKISFIKEPSIQNNVEYLLYKYMKDAAGADGILEPNEFKKYCERNYMQTNKIYTALEKELLRLLKNDGYVEKSGSNVNPLRIFLLIAVFSPFGPFVIFLFFLYALYSIFFGKLPFTNLPLTDKGFEMYKNITRFKNYLEDYSALVEHSYINAELWDTYMVYASAMGISDKVREEFSKLNPQYIAERQTHYNSHRSVSRTFVSGMKSGMSTYSRKTGSSGGRSGRGGGRSRGGGGGGRGGGGGGRR